MNVNDNENKGGQVINLFPLPERTLADHACAVSISAKMLGDSLRDLAHAVAFRAGHLVGQLRRVLGVRR